MYITWFGPPSANAAAMEVRDEEDDNPDEHMELVDVREGTLCIDPAEPVRFCNELDDNRCCWDAWTKELYSAE